MLQNDIYQHLVTFFIFIFSAQFRVDWLFLPKNQKTHFKNQTENGSQEIIFLVIID